MAGGIRIKPVSNKSWATSRGWWERRKDWGGVLGKVPFANQNGPQRAKKCVFVGFKVQPCGAIRVIEEAREANKVKVKHPD